MAGTAVIQESYDQGISTRSVDELVEGEWPYLWLDAAYVKARREVLGMTIGNSEAEPFWTEFLRSLTRRGLRGVKLVISDASGDVH